MLGPERARVRAAVSSRCMALLALLAASTAPLGAEVEDLYVAQVPVAGKGATDRDDATARALAAVLVKVTGRAEVPAVPEVRAALGRASAYLQQYRYETVMRPGEEGVEVPRQVLSVAFDPDAVNAVLAESGLPIWSRVRPATLLWLAVARGGERSLVGPGDPEGLVAVAEGAARRRGIPLVLPLLDLEDRGRLRIADAWGGVREPLAAASARYAAEAALLGRISGRPGAARGRWTLLLGGATEAWEIPASSPAEAVRLGIEEAADRLVARFVQPARGTEAVALVVDGVESLEDYARVGEYLESLDLVGAVALLAAEGRRVSYRLEVRGGREALTQVIALGRTLVDDETDGVGSARYRLASR